MNLDHIASSVNDPAVINDPAEADPTEVSTDNSPDLAMSPLSPQWLHIPQQ